jgi:hypothetical protein
MAVFEDEQWLGAMCRCFGERDGLGEVFERERPAFGDGQHVVGDETANLGQRAQCLPGRGSAEPAVQSAFVSALTN